MYGSRLLDGDMLIARVERYIAILLRASRRAILGKAISIFLLLRKEEIRITFLPLCANLDIGGLRAEAVSNVFRETSMNRSETPCETDCAGYVLRFPVVHAVH